jgi:hypothetical protein
MALVVAIVAVATRLIPLEIAAVLAETSGRTIPRIAAALHTRTARQRTNLVAPPAGTLSPTVRPAHEIRLDVRVAVSPAIAPVQVPATEVVWVPAIELQVWVVVAAARWR